MHYQHLAAFVCFDFSQFNTVIKLNWIIAFASVWAFKKILMQLINKHLIKQTHMVTFVNVSKLTKFRKIGEFNFFWSANGILSKYKLLTTCYFIGRIKITYTTFEIIIRLYFVDLICMRHKDLDTISIFAHNFDFIFDFLCFDITIYPPILASSFTHIHQNLIDKNSVTN